MREERDAAQADAERARKACGIAEVHLAEAAARGDTLAAELHVSRVCSLDDSILGLVWHCKGVLGRGTS